MLWAAWAKTFVVLEYRYDKQNIAEQKCENRTRPWMHCEGRCYLSRQLKKAGQKEAPAPGFESLKELSPFVTGTDVQVRIPETETRTNGPGYVPVFWPLTPAGSVFHPPEA